VATAGKLPLHDALVRKRPRNASASSGNSAFRLGEVWGAFAVSARPALAGPVLVIADRYDTGWTMTVVAHLLRTAGTGPVLPFALART
jgi:ATP-dependent DNA helicase RecQ